MIYGKERTVLVTYNPDLYTAQFLTVEQDIRHTIEGLSEIKDRLKTRAESAEAIRGRQPTEQSVTNQCEECMKRPYMDKVIDLAIFKDINGNLLIEYAINVNALSTIANTYLGKNILITSRDKWDDNRIIRGYRSQFIIEDVFKEMKDRRMGEWWPMHHWTDTKIHVHALYCTIAVMLRALVMRRVRLAGHSWSLSKVFNALSEIKEVCNVYKPTGRGRKPHVQKLLTRKSEIQVSLMTALNLSSAAFADGYGLHEDVCKKISLNELNSKVDINL